MPREIHRRGGSTGSNAEGNTPQDGSTGSNAEGNTPQDGSTGSNAEGNTPQKDTEQLVTKEWLMENYGITEEDLKELDLDLIFQSDPWKVSEVDYTDKKSLLNGLRYEQEQIFAAQENAQWLAENSLSYVLEGTACRAAQPDADALRWIILESAYIDKRGGIDDDNSPTGYNSAVVDVQNSILYFGFYNNPLSEDYRGADEIYTFNELEKQSILNAVVTANVAEWPSCDRKKE